jgi:hypothetical protein
MHGCMLLLQSLLRRAITNTWARKSSTLDLEPSDVFSP